MGKFIIIREEKAKRGRGKVYFGLGYEGE